jgi:hypothetical protein
LAQGHDPAHSFVTDTAEDRAQHVYHQPEQRSRKTHGNEVWRMNLNSEALGTKQVILWWEDRRLVYNLILLVVGVVSIVRFEYILSPMIPRGEDAIESMALALFVVLYAVGANLCYTLGWVIELIMRKRATETSRVYGRFLFVLGVALSCALTTLPVWFACFTRFLHHFPQIRQG